MAKKPRGREQDIVDALRRRKVMTLGEIREVLGGVSEATAFRRLRGVSYRRSYDHNGRYYALDEPGRYDKLGLWSFKGIRFSRDGTLTSTVRRLVEESETGRSQRELQEVLGVRVQNVLKALLERSEIAREAIGGSFVYLHQDPGVARSQQARRREICRRTVEGVPLESVVEVLLMLLRHPGSAPASVARRLRDRSPPVKLSQVQWVFDRYQLGEKGGLSTS